MKGDFFNSSQYNILSNLNSKIVQTRNKNGWFCLLFNCINSHSADVARPPVLDFGGFNVHFLNFYILFLGYVNVFNFVLGFDWIFQVQKLQFFLLELYLLPLKILFQIPCTGRFQLVHLCKQFISNVIQILFVVLWSNHERKSFLKVHCIVVLLNALKAFCW